MIQSNLIQRDIKLYHTGTDKRCIIRNPDVVENLGQVEYIFSDKTGTLTENNMEFRLCTIGEQIFGDLDNIPTINSKSKNKEDYRSSVNMSIGNLSSTSYNHISVLNNKDTVYTNLKKEKSE